MGLWYIMATTDGCFRKEFWSVWEVNIFRGAPFRLNDHDYMERNRFDDIVANLRYTNQVATTQQQDKFHQILQLHKAWNDNMATNFRPSRISCLYESMSIWTNPHTCPGYMYVPRKPWPFGNEYHSICRGSFGSNLMCAVELVEGKELPAHIKPDFEEKGKNVGLLLRLTRSICHTGNCLVLDSGFCVLRGITELRKVGAFAVVLIKKRRCWPKYMRGDEIKEHFADKDVGDVDSRPGKLDEIPFHLVCMKESDYIMSLMSSYGILQPIADAETTRNYENTRGESVRKKYNYTEFVYNHYHYRHAVDDHNSKRHQPISLEVIWATQWWPHRMMAFFMAITKVNVKLASEYFYSRKCTGMIPFRKSLAEALILNKELISLAAATIVPRMATRARIVEHKFETIELFKRWKNGAFLPGRTPYTQRKCIRCPLVIWIYCECYVNHCIKTAITHHGQPLS